MVFALVMCAAICGVIIMFCLFACKNNLEFHDGYESEDSDATSVNYKLPRQHMKILLHFWSRMIDEIAEKYNNLTSVWRTYWGHYQLVGSKMNRVWQWSHLDWMKIWNKDLRRHSVAHLESAILVWFEANDLYWRVALAWHGTALAAREECTHLTFCYVLNFWWRKLVNCLA